MISWDNLDALTRHFESCNVSAGSSVALVVDDNASQDLVELTTVSMDRLGAVLIQLRANSAAVVEVAHSPIVDGALRHADFVITCGATSQLADWWLSRGETDQRLLHLSPAAAHAAVYRPQQSMRRRTASLAQTLRKADAAILSDAHGTELRVDLVHAAVVGSSGTALDPGSSSTFPGGMVLIETPARSIDGTLVIMPGDANPELGSCIHSPVRISIESSFLTRVDGETADADSIRSVLEQSDSSDPFTAATLRVGVNAGRMHCVDPFDPILLDMDQSPIAAGLIEIGFVSTTDSVATSEHTSSAGDTLQRGNPEHRLTFVLPRRSLTVDGLDVVARGKLQGAFGPDVYETAG